MKGRVLVVDDDRQMVRTLCDILAIHGWDTDGAFSGEEAVAAVERREYAAVVMDVRMPGIHGVDALKAMKAFRPAVPVILMTAYTATELLAEAERAGVLRILPKPVAVPALVELIEEAGEAQERILVVDDDRDFLRTLATLLRERDYVVLEASGLDDAIARMEEKPPAVVVLDLRLDHVQPRDSVVAIHTVNPAVVLILYSGHPRLLDETAAALPSGWIYACLEKPFPPERLFELLDAVLER